MNLITGRNTPGFAKDTVYRFTKMIQINWIRFTTLLASQIIRDAIIPLDSKDRTNVLCLNTHKPASLYKRYKPEEARRIIRKLDVHYTLKHGSWLDMAEIELNVLAKQCLSRRMGTFEALRSEISAWEAERNQNLEKILWHFQTGDARTKLISLYPTIISDSQ